MLLEATAKARLQFLIPRQRVAQCLSARQDTKTKLDLDLVEDNAQPVVAVSTHSDGGEKGYNGAIVSEIQGETINKCVWVSSAHLVGFTSVCCAFSICLVVSLVDIKSQASATK